MLKLDLSLRAWGTPDFETVLRQELAQHKDHLPLQQGLSYSNYVADTPITVIVNRVADTAQTIHIAVGIFYQGILSGCSCADDPTPNSELNEHCEITLDIDKTTAAATVTLLPDD